jgi:hypothetical protein
VRTSEAQRIRSGLWVGVPDKLPLLTGKILFDPVKGMPPATLDILDGRYEGRAPVGKTTVRINSSVKYSLKSKMKIEGQGYDQGVGENILPARHSKSSEIVAGQPNVFNFDLKKQ